MEKFERQMSLLANEEENNNSKEENKKLQVVRFEFSEGLEMNWQELFSGFDTIHAITYSSGLDFTAKLLSLFENAEILFGCEQVMSYSLHEVMAFQMKLSERIFMNKSAEMLADRIEAGTLKMYVAREELSHEKIYLLSAKDGRKRVVFGSANMSLHAFSAIQRENIGFVDGEQAYSWYKKIYQDLKENCTDEITKRAIAVKIDEEATDELPIVRTVRAKKILEIVEGKQAETEVKFAMDISGLAEKYREVVPKPDKNGKILLSPEHIETISKKIIHKKEQQIKEKRKIMLPKFIFDIESREANLNGKPFNLSPDNESVRNDAQLFIQYMKGYERFHGDYEEMQRNYFNFLNWMFCSPFMAVLRDKASHYGKEYSFSYPVFGLICGNSKGGKSKFLALCMKMMSGINENESSFPVNHFTKTIVSSLRNEVRGLPIIFNDIVKKRFDEHAVEMIKNDIFGFEKYDTNYPAVAISANSDLKVFSSEIRRRMIICRINGAITNMEIRKDNITQKVMKNIGTALYCEYFRRMLDAVFQITEEMQNDDDESPDILQKSSEILCSVLYEFSGSELPQYVRKISLADYFSEKVVGKHIVEFIRMAWNTDKSNFQIDKKNNLLTFNAGETYEAKRFEKELPESLFPKQVRECVIMNLDAAREFFELDFKIGVLDKLKNKK